MKFYFYSFNDNNAIKKYVYVILKNVAKKKGHEIVENPGDADFICVNFTDISEINELSKALRIFDYDKLVIGGYSAKYIKLANIFGKYVWVGHCFEFFDCRSKDEVVEHRSCYVDGKKRVVCSDKVEWDLVPGILLGSRLVLWAEKGCNRLCRFCSTSWTDRHERNSAENLEKAKIYCAKNRKMLHLLQNEYMDEITNQVKFLSVTVRRYLQNWNLIRSGATVRVGAEFINEDVRRKFIPAKFFTDEEFFELLNIANMKRHILRLFYITGIEPAENWYEFFERIAERRYTNVVLFKLTSITYRMFTPLFRMRFGVDMDNYIDREKYDKWHRNNIHKIWWKTSIGGAFDGIYRTALQLCENIEEIRWLNKIKNSDLSEEEKIYTVVDSDIYKRDYQ